VTLAREASVRVFGVDISGDALVIAGRNASGLVGFVLGDLCSAFGDGVFDVVVSNPPYVPEGDRAGLAVEVRDWEPAGALFAGVEGLYIYRRLIPEAWRVLKPGGVFAFEFGFGQAAAIGELMAGWGAVEIFADLAGIPRVAVGRRG
jgi:release factor glutamine methyltransferase